MTDQGAGPASTPAAEVVIDEDLVRRLLGDQHPDLVDLPIQELANGWDNTMFRLGTELTIRLPRRAAAAALVEHEQRWLPELAPQLSLPIPAPVRVGRATAFYPWSWSILPWFEGCPAGTAPDLDGPVVAEQLGRLLAELHRPASTDAPVNPVRGGPLPSRDAGFRARLDQLGGLVDRAAALDRWNASLEAPPWSGPPLWLHGDLHGHNLLADGGRLVAVIDFGDITGGDPATDLAVAHSLLDPVDHARFRQAATSPARPIDEAMWLRAGGWALSVGVAILASSADNPPMAAMARRMIGPSIVGG